MASLGGIGRTLVGTPLRSDRLHEQLLPKRLALPVFCSDPLSSVAYATEQIVLVLALGGLGLLALTPWLGAAVVLLLVIVVASYRQTCDAYPDGGGAYAVSRENLGEDASLVAACRTVSISARIEHLRAEDLIDDPVPTGRAPTAAVGRRRQVAALIVAAVGLPLLTLLLRAAGDGLSLE